MKMHHVLIETSGKYILGSSVYLNISLTHTQTFNVHKIVKISIYCHLFILSKPFILLKDAGE